MRALQKERRIPYIMALRLFREGQRAQQPKEEDPREQQQ